MRKFLVLLALLFAPVLGAQAQYTHRSNPGNYGASPGTLAATGTTNAMCMGSGGADSLTVRLSGVATGVTSQFVWTNDGINFIPLPLFPVSTSTGLITGPAASSFVYTSNTPAIFQGSSEGAQYVCVYMSAYSTGALSVSLDGDPSSTFEIVSTPGGTPISISPYPTSTVGTQIACNAGASPCTISNSAAIVLNANTSRKGCSLENVGVIDLYCRRAVIGSAASAAVFDFLLGGAGALKQGGVYSCESTGLVWQGPVNCIASAASAVVDLAVTETQ